MTLAMTLHPAEPTQQGRALVRMPLDKMETLNITAGDTIKICADRYTHARVMPGQRGSDQITASEELIQNVGAAWGAIVKVEAVPLPSLTTVVVKVVCETSCSAPDLSEALFDLPLTEGDMLKVPLSLGRHASIEIIALEPAPAGLFRETTSLSSNQRPKQSLGYNQIGGLDDQIQRVHEMVAVPLLRPELFVRLGVCAPRGVLFSGPPGSGKTLLARNIAAQTSAAFYQINGPEIVSKHYGESEAALRKVFQAAEKDAPAIIFIDEIDAIAPRREALSGEKQVERRIVAQLLTLMDGLAERGRIIIMAATNLPDSLDPALRRPGRFDREIHFGPPQAKQRQEILSIHLRDAPLAHDVNLEAIAQQSHGYVGADLAALAREASLAALDRAVTQAGGDDKLVLDDLFITQPDLVYGLTATAPSILRDTLVESPVVTFADVGGMQTAKSALTEAVIWPQQHKAICAQLNLKPMSGVLMSGPPGSGKTLLARALATESGVNFIPVRPGRIMSQFLGDAERAVSEVFAKARQSAPCLVFFDEIDALAPRRAGKDATLDRVVAQLLSELDGLASNVDVSVLAATNRAAAIDPALLRPGRFDLVIAIPLPDMAARRAILDVHCRHVPLAPDIDLDQIARDADGASGASLAALVTGAARSALRMALAKKIENPVISASDFLAALTEMRLSEAASNSDFIDGNTQ